MNIDHPYGIDGHGRTAEANEADHLRDLIEQVLFTSPGERVNRPEFGCGLRQLVFAPNSNELAAATKLLIQGALQRWLGDRIEVRAVDVTAEHETLRIDIGYVALRTRQVQVARFQRAAL